MSNEIRNFTGRDILMVRCMNHENIGQLVHLVHDTGSLRFQFSLRPEQAMSLAALLLTRVHNLEQTTS